MAPLSGTEQWHRAAETLVALGAPLAGVEPHASLDAEQALLDAKQKGHNQVRIGA